ncbi:MAG TPA: DUF6152 family protein [Steroidobacteraceae bacterium]|nr:DUF6152 family protein [Steroidobacteraceae bacterium]
MSILKAMVTSGMLAGLLGAVSFPAPAATPSSPDVYSVHQTVTIEGMVVRFTFRDPYSLVYVMTTDKNGTLVTWVLQWLPATALRAEDINRDTLTAGDHVIVTGNPARDPRSHHMRMKAIERPADGWMWVKVTSD